MSETCVITKEEIEKKEIEKNDETDVSVIILLNKNSNFGGLDSFEIDLCGKKTWEWLQIACRDYEIKKTICFPESNILSLIKPMLTNKKYTLVLFSDTPLLTKSTIEKILDYVRTRDINVLCLIRGYVFNTEYIKSADSIIGDVIEKFSEIEFLTIDNPLQFEKVAQILKTKIIGYHLLNGVIITDSNSVEIDADVTIESGSFVMPFNCLKGRTYIGKNCYLESGNTIIDSIIEDGCKVKSSYIFNSKINKNMVIGPFEKVINK